MEASSGRGLEVRGCCALLGSTRRPVFGWLAGWLGFWLGGLFSEAKGAV